MKVPLQHRSKTVLCVLAMLFVAALAVGGARGEDLPSAGAVASADRPGVGTHGWFAVKDSEAGGAILAHVPPRRMRGADGKSHGAADGTIRRAGVLPEMPDAMGAVDDRVYVAFERRGVLSVGSVTARLTPAADLWSFEPPGRLRTHPDLPLTGKLLAFVGSPIGPAVLEGGSEPDSWWGATLWVLVDDRWMKVPLPETRRLGELSRCTLFSTRESLAILAIDSQGYGTLWQNTVLPPEPAQASNGETASGEELDDTLHVSWSTSPISLDQSLKDVDMRSARLVCAGGVLTLAAREADDRISIYSLTKQSAYRIAEFPSAPVVSAMIPLDSPGRLVFAWATAASEPSPAPKGKKPAMKLEVREISAYTGREFYKGDGRNDLPVSARDIRVLTFLLVGVMVAVLLVVLRRDPEGGAYSLPEGMSLAEPGRRFFAGLIDFAVALLVASRVVSVPLGEVFSPTGVLEGQAWTVIGAALGAGLIIGTITEWLTGRSPGKLFVGCEVVDVRAPVEEVRRPSLSQALVRNLVKWGVPPAAVFGLMEGEGRHRGDAIARTAVVVEGVEEEPEDEDF